jgi:hypothetical protein
MCQLGPKLHVFSFEPLLPRSSPGKQGLQLLDSLLKRATPVDELGY